MGDMSEMAIGWDENGHAAKTGVEEIDRHLGRGDLQDAQNCGYSPASVLADMGMDESHGSALEQYAAGEIHLSSGATLERRGTWDVWACTSLGVEAAAPSELVPKPK